MPLEKRSAWQVHRAVIKALYFRELRTKVGEHVLGPAWLIIEPLIHIATLTIIFTFVRDRAGFQGVPFAAFFTAGIIPYFIFQSTANRCLRAIRQYQQLFSYKQVKTFDPIIAIGLVEASVYSFLFLIMIWVGEWFFSLQALPHKPIEVFITIFLLSVLSVGIGLIFAVIGARWEDIGGILINLPMRLLYFISGIIIPLSELPDSLHKYLLWNPILHGVEQIRVNTFDGYTAPETSITYLAVFSLIFLFLGTSYFGLNRSRVLLLR